MKQDRLAELEAQLNVVDAEERTQWYLSSRRADQNPERIRLTRDIDIALEEYGKTSRFMMKWRLLIMD